MDLVPGRAVARGHDAGRALGRARTVAFGVEVADITAQRLDDGAAGRMIPGHHAAEGDKVQFAAGQSQVVETGTADTLHLLDPVAALLHPFGGFEIAFRAHRDDAAELDRRRWRRQALPGAPGALPFDRVAGRVGDRIVDPAAEHLVAFDQSHHGAELFLALG